MQHLDTERIAAFDHEAPTHGELAHLAACTICRAERTAFSSLSQRAMHLIDAAVFPPAPRLTNWDSLSKQLRAERLIVGGAGSEHHSTGEYASTDASDDLTVNTWPERARPRQRFEWWRAAAAALLFAVGGAGLGRISAGVSPFPKPGESSVSTTANVLNVGLGANGFNSIEDATKALTKAEKDFDKASVWLMANDPSAKASDVLRRRLAALNEVVSAAYVALEAAPQDKVLDHYYRSAYSAREATLQQLSRALPVGGSIERF